MICPKCGKSNDDNSIFCRECGCRLPEITEKKQPKRNGILISAIIIALVLTTVIVAAISGKSRNKSAQDTFSKDTAISSDKVDSDEESSVPEDAESDAASTTSEKQASEILLDFAADACAKSTYYAGSSVDCAFGYVPDNYSDHSKYYYMNMNPHEAMYLNQYDGILTYAVGDYDNDQEDELSSSGASGSTAENIAEEADNNDYILPDSDKRYLSQDDLVLLSPEELRLARNEIYARHGRIFKDESLRKYFSSKDWYVPRVAADDFTDDMLNEYETANKDLIAGYEKSH